MMRRTIVAGAVALALCGCGGRDRLIGREGLTIVNQQALPPPESTDSILQQRSYVIGPLDRVVVEVYGAPDLSRTAQVDAGGMLSLPLIGAIAATAKTPEQLATEIEGRLRGKYVRDPKVTVSLDTASQVVTVEGQVAHPGLYPVVGRMTLVRAVASAQGLTQDADKNFVVVYRQVGGRQYAALYDLRAIRQGQYADPEIYANDIVSVGESNGRRAFQALIQGTAVLAGPLIAILN